MLTRSEVEELARRHGLADHAERLADRVRPGWSLNPIGGMRPAPAATKIGGHPDLAPGEEWPRNERGIAMTFLGQIDTREVPAWGSWKDERPWQHGGQLVRVFADLVDCPFEPTLALALACDPTGPLRRVTAPAIPDLFPSGGPWPELPAEDRFRALPEAPVSLAPLLTPPETDPVLSPKQFDFSPSGEAYRAWWEDVRSDTASPHQLLGEPSSVQHSALSAGPAERGEHDAAGYVTDGELTSDDDWRLLLDLHEDVTIGLHILDAGAFTVVAPVEDLAAGRYDRLVCDVSSC